jgi:acyl-CoA synthetase (AMP-forming)/AMP-acid ligase II
MTDRQIPPGPETVVGVLRDDSTLAGHQSEMCIRGGYDAYPAGVEAVLRRHPGVHDVAVVGFDDPVLGEIGAAFVVPGPSTHDDGTPAAPPGLEDLRAWCFRELADYKAPDRLYLLDALPLTPMGKVDTTKLQAGAAVSSARGAS